MIISITPDLALDEGFTFAGGLGVLEGDKFYGAARLGLSYKVLTFLYGGGYVDYDFDAQGNPIAKPQAQPPEFLQKLVYDGVLSTRLKNEEVKVEIHKFALGEAEAVFFKPVEPDWAARLASRLYISENDEDKFYTYALLAKTSAEYLKRHVGVGKIDYIDLQEAYACILPLVLKIPGKYRYVIHTPGVWGHPLFPREYFEREFGYRFINPLVSLTEVGLAAAREAFTVSAKHFEVMSKILPQYSDKIRYVTNGINVHRWMDPDLKSVYDNGNLQQDSFIAERGRLRSKFLEFLRRYKNVDVGDRMIIAWCRRLVPYKRPELVIKAIEELSSKDIVFVLGGKAHPQDGMGLDYMRQFRKIHYERENVVYIPNYDIPIAKNIHKGADLILFTPLLGFEACGTSYMKAAVNGVPTLASRDGAAVELIVNGVNGWLFGADIKSFEEIHGSFAGEMQAQDSVEFTRKLNEIASMYRDEKESYYKVSMNALSTLIPRVNMERVLREYYHDALILNPKSAP